MSEGVMNEPEATGDAARTEAEDRLLGRLDYALRGLRGQGAPAPRPLASRSLTPDRKRAALAVALAHAHFGAGALEAAEREFRDAVAQDPDNADAHCGLVVTLANLFRLDEAERELRAAEQAGVKLSPSVRDEIDKRRQLASGDSGQGRET
jgi:Flp pilus assembly protein TadD